MNEKEMYAVQDDCLISIEDGKPVRAKHLGVLPPWRAVLIGRVAERAGVPLEGGTIAELVAEAKRVGGEGTLVWPPKKVSQELQGL
jgi:hypothetical protein